MTKQQSQWVSRLKRLMKEMPAGIEIIVGHDCISVMEEGFCKRECYDSGIDMMSDGGMLITENAITQVEPPRSRVIPNSESI